MVTLEQLKLVMPRCPDTRAEEYHPHLAAAMDEASIDTVTRAAAFLGQLAWESGELRYMEELASGEAYEGRKDLGNVNPGDGRRYKGRGPIQLTGKSNYRRAGRALGVALVERPELAAEPRFAFRVAAWYWTEHDLNNMADAMRYDKITRAINGGMNHHDKRVTYYHRALEVLGTTSFLEKNNGEV